MSYKLFLLCVTGGLAWSTVGQASERMKPAPFEECEAILSQIDPPSNLMSLPVITTTVGSHRSVDLVAQLRTSRRTPIQVGASADERRFVTFFGMSNEWSVEYRADFVWRAEGNLLEVTRVAKYDPSSDGPLRRLSNYRSVSRAEKNVILTRAATESSLEDSLEPGEIISSLEHAIAPAIVHAHDPNFVRWLGRSESGKFIETVYHVDPERLAVVVFAARDAQLYDNEDFKIDLSGWQLRLKRFPIATAGSLRDLTLKLPPDLLIKLVTKHLLSVDELIAGCANAPPLVDDAKANRRRRTFVVPMGMGRFMRVAVDLARGHALLVSAYFVRQNKYREYRGRVARLGLTPDVASAAVIPAGKSR